MREELESELEAREQAIENCTMCDPDGYMPSMAVCDHVDRTGVAERGMAKVRAVLANRKPKPRPVETGDLFAAVQVRRESGPPQPITDPEPEL